MQIIAKSTLRAFWEKHPQAETPLKTWHAVVRNANWAGPSDVKSMFGANVDFVSDNRIISTYQAINIALSFTSRTRSKEC